jgi:hypothetical protein
MKKLILSLLLLCSFALNAQQKGTNICYTYDKYEIYNIDSAAQNLVYKGTNNTNGSIVFLNETNQIRIDNITYNMVSIIREDKRVSIKAVTINNDNIIIIKCTTSSLSLNIDGSVYVYKNLKLNN